MSSIVVVVVEKKKAVGGVSVEGVKRKHLKQNRIHFLLVLLGDVILMINNQDIAGLDDFEELVEKIEPGRAVALRVWRNGTASFIAYTPRDKDEG